jgi:hypothetical protein
MCRTELLDLVSASKVSLEGQKYSKCRDNIRGFKRI